MGDLSVSVLNGGLDVGAGLSRTEDFVEGGDGDGAWGELKGQRRPVTRVLICNVVVKDSKVVEVNEKVLKGQSS